MLQLLASGVLILLTEVHLVHSSHMFQKCKY